MDLSSDYYPYFEVNGKNGDLIFRELTTNPIYQEINDGTWKEKFINRYGQMLEETPNVRTTANNILHKGLLAKGFNIDPEKVYVNTFSSSVVVGNKGVYHREGSLIESYRLTDAALMNYFVENFYDNWYLLGAYDIIGIYSVGKNGKADPDEPLFGNGWSPSSQVCAAKEPADVLYASDIQAAYLADYKAYWNKYYLLYSEMIADLFIAAAIQQYKRGLLSEYGFAMIRKVYGKQPGVDTYWFNINQYDASDIIVMVGKVSGMDHTVLYISGAATPFIEFDNFTQMRIWLIKQLADPLAMNAFKKHFSIYDRQDGSSYSGVDSFLEKMVSGTWNPQDYIMLKPVKLPYAFVFDKMRDQMKFVMEDDAEKQITSNSEFYRDYILDFVQTMIAQVAVFDMLVPEIGIPLDLALSATSVGLSADIAIKGDTYEKRLDGVGSLVGSAIYTVTNLLPVFISVGSILKDFTRPASEIAAYADEEQFMMRKFHINTPEELHAIRAGDPPHILINGEREIRLVRLANGTKQLVMIRNIGDNKYIRLNPITFEEVRGEGFITETLATDSVSRRRLYLSNSKLIGGAPYNSYEYFFDEIWTVEELKIKADKLGTNDVDYIGIKGRLHTIHNSVDFFTKQKAAHELIELIDGYLKSDKAILRKNVLSTLAQQVKDTLYDHDVEFLKKNFLESGKQYNPLAISLAYKISHQERLGELRDGVTLGFFRFIKEDDILSIEGKPGTYHGEIPSNINFDVKYVIEDLSEFDTLPNDFTKLPEYTGKGLASNKAVFQYALNESHNLNLLEKCVVSSDGEKLFIGHSYAELVSTITNYSCNANTIFGIHPAIVLDMLRDLLKGGGEGAMMKRFGRVIYLNQIIEQRLGSVEEIIQYYDYVVFDRYDKQVKNVFGPTFDKIITDKAKLDVMMSSRNGILLFESEKEINFCRDNLDFFKSKGVTHIGLTSFYADLHQPEIDTFLNDGNLTAELTAIIISTDKGVQNGPMFNLMMKVREEGLKIVALGHSDGALYTGRSVFTQAYNKGVTVKYAADMLRNKKCIVLSSLQMANTSPGLLVPTPGLSQILKIPAFRFSKSGGSLEFWPDLITSRSIIYIKLEKIWTKLSPEPGRFMGWVKYDENFVFPTAQQREEALFAKVYSDLEGFKREYNEIRTIAFKNQCLSARHCNLTATQVNDALNNANKRVGKGVCLSWWQWNVKDFVNQVHTAPTVFIQDMELVVDATYVDITGEAVVIQPIDDWVKEVINKYKGYNPYLRYGRLGVSLYGFNSPDFTRPRIRKPR